MSGTPPFDAAVDGDRALHELAKAVTGGGADQFDAFVLARTGEYTRFADGRIHQPQDVTEVQVMVRAVVDGHAARASASSLAGLDAAVSTAARMARGIAAAAPNPGHTTVATPDTGSADDTGSAVLFDDGTAAFDAAARAALVAEASTTADAARGSVAGMFGRAVNQLVVATSAGVARATSATEASVAFTFSVAEGTAHFANLGRAVHRLGLSEALRAGAAQAVAGRGRGELEPGEYDVVLGPEATAELLKFLPGFGFSGELAAAGVGVSARCAGQQLASHLVTVADDALADVGLPIGFDIEGVPKQRVDLLRAGVVGSPVTDLATGAQLGLGSTGHAHIAREEPPATQAANLVMSAGGATEAELIAGVGRGVYIQRFWYTRMVDRNASTITGVTRDACFEIIDGALGRPLTGMRFTQSVLRLLSRVDAVASTRRTLPLMNVWNGSSTAPAIRAAGFRLGSAPMIGASR